MVSTYGLSAGIQHNWVKPLEKNLYEIRSRISNNQQRGLYFHVDGVHYVITHGFTKKTQKTPPREINQDRKSTRLNSSHVSSSYAVFCLKQKLTSTQGQAS